MSNKLPDTVTVLVTLADLTPAAREREERRLLEAQRRSRMAAPRGNGGEAFPSDPSGYKVAKRREDENLVRPAAPEPSPDQIFVRRRPR